MSPLIASQCCLFGRHRQLPNFFGRHRQLPNEQLFFDRHRQLSNNSSCPFHSGVGMDDAFVLLAAWRRTSPTQSVPERLSHTYSEAAVSISITSLTNFISFMIGII